MPIWSSWAPTATAGLKDLIFGNTINPVRHQLDVPMLIVRPGKT